jgi:hypothetical protein
MHLISVRSKEDADKIAEAVRSRFANYEVSVQETDDFINNHDYLEYEVRSEYTGKKRLTIPEANIAAVLLPSYAQAFYAGLVLGRKDAYQHIAQFVVKVGNVDE